jgi:hypothetical protein
MIFGVQAESVRPYRFLLVVNDQWKDPASYVIDEDGEFQALAATLKTWGLPFDVLRLDQQQLDRYHLLDRDGRPRYGTIIWDAGPADLRGKGLEVLEELIKKDGLGLVVLGDSIAVAEISGLTGVRFVSDFISPDKLAIARDHFLTRELKGRGQFFPPEDKQRPGNKVSAGCHGSRHTRTASVSHGAGMAGGGKRSGSAFTAQRADCCPDCADL